MIRKIDFDAASGLSPVDLSNQAGVHPGDPYRANEIRQAIRRLYETGRFKDVWVEVAPLGEEIEVRFRFVEKRTLSSIDFSGNHFITRKEIFESISVKQGEEFTEKRWERALSEMTALYHQAGYFQAAFDVSLTRDPQERRNVHAFVLITEGEQTKIRSVSFQGKPVFPDSALLSVINSRKGEFYRFKSFSKFYRFQSLEDDIGNLERFYTDAGYLKAVIGPPQIIYIKRTNEVDLIIPIESSNRTEIFFKDPGPYSDKKLKKLLVIKEERSDEDDVLEESAKQIETFYRSEGFPFAKVRVVSRRLPEENRVEARFNIESGPQTIISAIEFSGSPTFTPKRLRKLLRLQPKGPFSWLVSESPYTQEFLQEDTAALTAFYKKEGFRDLQISPEVRFDSTRTFATITFKIDEGIRTRIGQIEMKGNEALSTETLKKNISIQPENPYHESTVRDGERQILFLYSKQGYPHTQVAPSVQFSQDQTTADVTYSITEGEQVRLGHVKLQGNLRTKDHILLREMALKEGDPYDPEKLLETQRRLFRTGIFSGARFDPIHPEERPAIQDVQLSVIERPNIGLEFGIGYADFERLRGFFEVTHRNLFGTDRQITARADTSRVEEKYSLNYKEPWFFSRTIDARVGVAYIVDRQLSFNLRSLSSTAGVDKSFSDTLKGSFLYQYERNRSTVIPQAQLAPEDLINANVISIGSLNPSLIRDTRDDPFNPHSGSVNGINFRDAAKILGSEAQFVKATVQSSWYFSLSQKLIFAFSARAGAAQRFGQSQVVPASERFIAGGRSTVRGYDQDRLGIPGVTIVGGKPTGGDGLLIFNEELRIVLPKSFGLVLFFDHGNVWLDYRDIKFSEIKSTTGVGLRYNTPVGPLRLDWGYKLNRAAEESAWALHFTLGHAF